MSPVSLEVAQKDVKLLWKFLVFNLHVGLFFFSVGGSLRLLASNWPLSFPTVGDA